jgi:hypothetical protein
MAMALQNPHDGSSFESLLKEEGVLEETRKHALKAVRAWQRAAKAPRMTRSKDIKTKEF